jgi:hypothetical protein
MTLDSSLHDPRTMQPQAGADVVTLDGDTLGKVKEVRGSYFKVDVRWGRDFWLSFDELRHCEPDRVSLVLVKNQVDEYKLSKPATAEAYTDAAHDVLISDAEREEQRRKMESDLERQRSLN